MEKIRHYAGRRPTGGEWWMQGLIRDEGMEFELWQKGQGHTPDWVTCKLVALGKVPRKGNYWFAVNTQTKQVGYSRDLAMLRQHRPELHRKVSEMIGI